MILAFLLLGAAAANPATGFVQSLPPYRAERQVAGRIVLWGHGSPKHNFVGDLLDDWIRGFRRQQPGVTFENRMYGTASAIGALSLGAGNLALLGEEISPDAEKEFRRAKGYAPTGIPVATGSLDVPYFDYAHMIFVHAGNPVRRLSLRQLDGIFGAEARRGGPLIRHWRDLGVRGALGEQEIHPYSWPVDEDFALFFRQRVLLGSHRWNPAIREFDTIVRPDGKSYEHGQRILEALARDPAGIAISTVRFQTAAVKVVALSENDGGPAVMPSAGTVLDQSYPLTRIIPAFVDRPPGRPISPEVREFLDYVLSREGQAALVKDSGYLPLSPEALERSRALLP